MTDLVSIPGKQPVVSVRWADYLANRCIALVACLIVVAWILGPVIWVADLVSHFWPFGGFLIIPASLWCFYRRRKTTGRCAVIVTLIWAWPLAVYFWPQDRDIEGQRLTVVVCNLYSGNPEAELAAQRLLSYDADVVVLLEVSPEWMPHLKQLSDVYPHGKFIPRDDNFGIGLLSRFPLREITQKNFGSTSLPSLIAELEDWPLTIVATHPLPPMGMTYSDRRNRQLMDIASYCRESPREMIVAGDLNITPWSIHFGQLLRQGNLRDSSAGLGIQPSWPAWTGLPLLPIDHVLVSDRITVANRYIGETIGSDHHPVIVKLILPENSR